MQSFLFSLWHPPPNISLCASLSITASCLFFTCLIIYICFSSSWSFSVYWYTMAFRSFVGRLSTFEMWPGLRRIDHLQSVNNARPLDLCHPHETEKVAVFGAWGHSCSPVTARLRAWWEMPGSCSGCNFALYRFRGKTWGQAFEQPDSGKRGWVHLKCTSPWYEINFNNNVKKAYGIFQPYVLITLGKYLKQLWLPLSQWQSESHTRFNYSCLSDSEDMMQVIQYNCS